jgi:hypothetical protein
MHLGRRPGRLPPVGGGFAVDASELTPAAAWRSCVDYAIREALDAVALAGDVVDSLQDRFEAYSDLKAGVTALLDAGIPVFGVAGNHDVEALPRLAAQIPDFRLLGADGEWESALLSPRSGDPIRLLGWSFPAVRVRESPLESLRQRAEPGVATLGLLHCDVDGGESVYAPVARRALLDAPVDAWLLGHIHKPHDLSADPRPVGYLGSLMGLDPGEPGRRGPWRVEVDGPGRVRAQQLALAPLRWERVDVTVDSLDPALERGGEIDLEEALFALIREGLVQARERMGADEEAAGAVSPLRAVGVRVRLRGRCAGHHRLRGLLSRREQWPREIWGGVHYFVEKIEDHAGPALDLAGLAAGDDPPALLARRVLSLQTGDGAGRALLERAEAQLAEALSAARWQRVEAPLPKGEALRELLLRVAIARLEGLLEQRTQAAPSTPLASGAGR